MTAIGSPAIAGERESTAGLVENMPSGLVL